MGKVFAYFYFAIKVRNNEISIIGVFEKKRAKVSSIFNEQKKIS